MAELLNRGGGGTISAARLSFSNLTIQYFNDSAKAFRAK